MALTDGLIAHWKLNEASGTRVDSHASFDLTDNNTVTSRAMVLDDGASFDDNSSEYLSHADHADLSFPVDMSIVAWGQVDDLVHNGTFVAKYTTTGNQREYWIQFRDSSNLFRFLVSSDGSSFTDVEASTFGALSTGTNYMVFVYHDDGNEVGISVNDGTIDTVSFTGGLYAGTSIFTIGSRGNPNFYLDGGVDSVSIWNRKLTAQEVTDLYNGGAGLDYPWTTPVEKSVIISYEVLSAMDKSSAIIQESLAGLSASAASPYEGLLGLAKSGSVPQEALSVLAASDLIPYEARGQISNAEAITWESLVSVALSVQPSYEALKGVQAQGLVWWEATGQITADGTIWWETLKPTAASGTVLYEAIAGLAVAAVMPWEAAAGVAAGGVISWEALARPTTSGDVVWESLTPVLASAPLPWEGLVVVVKAGSPAYEAMAGLTSTGAIPWEALALGERPRISQTLRLIVLVSDSLSVAEAVSRDLEVTQAVSGNMEIPS